METISTVYELVKTKMAGTPEGIAIRFKDESITYNALQTAVETLSHHIKQQAASEQFIGVSTQRSVKQIIAVLAIHHAGKAYIPLDLTLPSVRLHQLITASQLHYYIQNGQEDTQLSQYPLKPIIETGASSPSLRYTQAKPDLAYVLFTSGSTGMPKGVCMGHSPLINLVQWQNKTSGCKEGSKTMQFAPLSFDVSFQEIYATLSSGGCLYLIDDEVRLDAHKLLEFLIENSINRIFLPFVALQYLAEESISQQAFPRSLVEIITAGETLKITPQVKSFISQLPDVTLCNQYGPTECHVVTELRLNGDPEYWPSLPSIGGPIDNTQIYILDEHLIEKNKGEIGELCISGLPLSQGYLNQEQQTEAKFVVWQHPSIGKIKLYRTGDEAKIGDDGNIYFIGRKDNQVKIRGHRVELEEIEIALCKISGISQAVVVVKDTVTEEKRLVAYLVASSGTSLTNILIKSQLQTLLPDYMIPPAIVWLPAFPKTSSGKIDKNALPEPKIERFYLPSEFKESSTLTQKKIVAHWEALFQLDKIGILDNFFDLGGNSLLAQKSISSLSEIAGKRLPVTLLYQYPTIEQLSAYIDNKVVITSRAKNTLSNNGEEKKDIAIIGMAVRFPGCETLTDYWNILINGEEKIHFFKEEELDVSLSPQLVNDLHYVPARGVMKDADKFDAEFFGIPPIVATIMDPQQRIFLEISREVLEASGYLPSISDETTGVFAGCGNNTYYLNNVLSHPQEIAKIGNFQTMCLNEKDYIASRTAYQLNLKGPAVSVHSACSTSLLAIATAVDYIRTGKCSIAIAGGASVTSPINSGHIYQEGSMLSKDGHCRPFDSNATGTVFSDGAGVVLLKDASMARRDGDLIYAVIKGTGLSNDGHDKGSFSAPSAQGQAAAIQMAMHDAKVPANNINYIETHGTATPLGDPIEIEGLARAFGDPGKKQYCKIGSVKGNFGHLTAAAGVAGLIKVALSLHHKKIPPSLHYLNPNPNIDFENSPFIVNTKISEWPDGTKLAGVSSFGVGGTNVHLIVQENNTENIRHLTESSSQVIIWSSKKPESQILYAKKLAHYLKNNPTCPLEQLAYTLQCSREDFSYRNYVVTDSVPDLIHTLESVTLQNQASVTSTPSLVFLFPGQGSQYLNMGHDLYHSEPVFKDAIDRCSDILMDELNIDLRELIFSNPSVEAEDRLNKTRYAQPALFTFCYSLAQLWLSWNIKPTAYIGHSLGEVVAAHLAGVLTLKDALTFVSRRGKLMASLPRGKMLSVRIPHRSLEEIMPATLSIAAMNAPDSFVLSGKNHEIDSFCTVLDEINVPYKAVKTSHAFHSQMLDPILKDLEKLICSFPLQSPNTPIVSTVTGRWLTEKEATAPTYWVKQTRNTVNYTAAIQFIEKELRPVYMEIGPGTTCAAFIRQHGTAYRARSVSSLNQYDENQSELISLKSTVARLWSLGVSVPWRLLHRSTLQLLPDIPGYAYSKKRFWLDIIPKNFERSPTNTLAQQHPSPVMTTTKKKEMENTTLNKLKVSLEEITGMELKDCDPHSSFIELGLDSLLLTQVAQYIKKEFQVPLTYRQLNENLNSMAALTTYLLHEGDTSKYAISPETARLIPVESEADLDESNVPKKPFGASPRIHRGRSILTEDQQQFLDEFILKYTHKTAGSKHFTQNNRKHTADPRVVSGFNPLVKEMVYPLVINRSEGSKLWDIDGNQYIDALNGFGTNLLGYQSGFIKRAIHEQVEKGFELGPQHPLAGEVCRLICELTGFDRAALCNTGSEAVLGAIRIARTTTGRSLIVAFNGSYHGINDEVIVRATKKLKSYPAASGIPQEAVENILMLDYGTQESLSILKERINEVAAVLVEPVQSRRPEFQPVDFLKEVRKITKSAESLLIFDEVITGFRCHSGGAQQLFSIRADLATYGKVIGGGLPIGVIAGAKEYMDALDGGFWKYGDSSMPESGVTYFAGTFVRHPLALAAANASLIYLQETGPSLQENLNKSTTYLANRMNQLANLYSLPFTIVHFSSLWRIKFKEEYPLHELLFALMREKGIHILADFPCFLTTAHSQNDIDQIISAFEESIKELTDVALIPRNKIQANDELTSLISNTPPIPNAIMGKDATGNPAWFVPDPNNKNKYLQIEF